MKLLFDQPYMDKLGLCIELPTQPLGRREALGLSRPAGESWSKR